MKKTAVHLDPQRVAEIAEYLKRGQSGDVALTDVMALAELMVGSMQDFFEALDKSVYGELRDIANYISRTKGEIRNLRASDIKETHIPTAGKELDEIVRSTENATNSIMEQAELIMGADTSDPAAYEATVNDAVIQIFEACSFQDLTGQRISKIVETLDFIDKRVSRFSEVIGINEDDGDEVLTEEEAAREKRKQDLILHGPQSEGEGVSQDAIDDMLNDGFSKVDTAAPAPAPAAKAAPAKDAPKAAAQKAAAPKAAAPKAATPKAATPKAVEISSSEETSQDDIDALFD